MICRCGWKYNGEEYNDCPKCGADKPKHRSGVGLPNHSKEDAVRRRYKSLRSNKPVKAVSDKRRKRIDTGGGEAKLFRKIWDVRKHFCQNKACGDYLGTEAKAHFFAHIHSKGARPDLRTNPANIVLLCFHCEVASYQQGFNKLVLPEPYKSMRDNPPKFMPKH